MKSPLQYFTPVPQGKDVRNVKGYLFNWTDEHLTPEQLEPLRHTYDSLSDDVLDTIAPFRNNRDAYTTLEEQVKKDNPPEVLTKFWNEVNNPPEGTDWDAVDRGQQVFYRYGGACLTGLCFQSLLGGMGMYKVVEVLARTGGFSQQVARRRMFETTQHILQCTRDLESIKPGGDGWKSSVKVRLLHAQVRQRIMRLHKEKPEYYDPQKYGIPVNDLDSIATIISFSGTLIWMSLPAQGIIMRSQEIEDYFALWRVIGHYLGTPLYPFKTGALAKAYMESILAEGMEPSATSQLLAQNIITSLAGQPPSFASPEFLTAQARWLNGDELCDDLGLMKVGLSARALVFAQCVVLAGMGYIGRNIKAYDQRRIATLRRVFYSIFIKNSTGLGHETNFEMQYIPEFNTKTLQGEAAKDSIHALRRPGIERRNFIILLLVIAALLASIWFSLVGGLFVVRFISSGVLDVLRGLAS